LLRDGAAQRPDLAAYGSGSPQRNVKRRLMICDWGARLVPSDGDDSKGRLGFMDYGPHPKLGVKPMQHHIRAIEKIALLAPKQWATLGRRTRSSAEGDLEPGFPEETEIRHRKRRIVVFDQELRATMGPLGFTPR
jgi:hypothetical protein